MYSCVSSAWMQKKATCTVFKWRRLCWASITINMFFQLVQTGQWEGGGGGMVEKPFLIFPSHWGMPCCVQTWHCWCLTGHPYVTSWEKNSLTVASIDDSGNRAHWVLYFNFDKTAAFGTLGMIWEWRFAPQEHLIIYRSKPLGKGTEVDSIVFELKL